MWKKSNLFCCCATANRSLHGRDEEEHRHSYKEFSAAIPERCEDNYCWNHAHINTWLVVHGTHHFMFEDRDEWTEKAEFFGLHEIYWAICHNLLHVSKESSFDRCGFLPEGILFPHPGPVSPTQIASSSACRQIKLKSTRLYIVSFCRQSPFCGCRPSDEMHEHHIYDCVQDRPGAQWGLSHVIRFL